MGFRTTIVSQDYAIHWPDWFVEKYEGWLHFTRGHVGNLASSTEAKVYDALSDLPADVQKAIDWEKRSDGFHLVICYLHECGGVDRCHIYENEIVWTSVDFRDWQRKEDVTHYYCSGCDVLPAKDRQAKLPLGRRRW